MKATYCWRYDRLRLYYSPPSLSKQMHDSLIKMGFLYGSLRGGAIKDCNCLTALAWTPSRHDILKKLCGKIGSHDSHPPSEYLDEKIIMLKHELKSKYEAGYMENAERLKMWKSFNFNKLGSHFNYGRNYRTKEMNRAKERIAVYERWIAHYERRIMYMINAKYKWS